MKLETLRSVVRALKKWRPATAEEALDVGLTLSFISAGSYRKVYAVEGLSLVIKFPMRMQRLGVSRQNVRHAVREWNSYNILKSEKKYRELRGYLPEFHYFDEDSGTALMQRYRQLSATKADTKRRVELVSTIASHIDHDPGQFDIHSENVGEDGWGNLKLLDLGWFTLRKARA